MSALHLFTAPLCPFAHRTRLTLAEKGLQVRVTDVDLRHKPLEFLAVSPQGQVPLLQVGDSVLWESAVIDEYLEETVPRPALLPADPVRRAHARAWIRFADARLYANTAHLLHARSDEARGVALAALRDDLVYMALHAPASGRCWMGEEFSLVDITFIPWFEQSVALEKLLGFTWPESTAALRRWYEHVRGRTAVKAQSRPAAFYLAAYAALQ